LSKLLAAMGHLLTIYRFCFVKDNVFALTILSKLSDDTLYVPLHKRLRIKVVFLICRTLSKLQIISIQSALESGTELFISQQTAGFNINLNNT